jgi:hypothetical protein
MDERINREDTCRNSCLYVFDRRLTYLYLSRLPVVLSHTFLLISHNKDNMLTDMHTTSKRMVLWSVSLPARSRLHTHNEPNSSNLVPLHLQTKTMLPGSLKTAKDGVSPGIEPGTTRNIDLEFSRTAEAKSSLSEYHTARPRDLIN